VVRRKFARCGFGGIFASDLMVDAKTILKRRIYVFDEGEREIKTRFLPWLRKAIEEAADVHALTVAIRETVKNWTMCHEARMPVLTVHAMESNDTELRRGTLHRLKLMLSEDVASDKIHQSCIKPKRRPTDKGPEAEEGVRATVNFTIELFVQLIHSLEGIVNFVI
jgi:hypothetical protein